mmetsp:Transcript_22084/g.67961  ORF Transcript_22084/g.67961 Transcript_22084/m.67961 type:complete len:226 (+) Transcript_22084:989-1666(+)
MVHRSAPKRPHPRRRQPKHRGPRLRGPPLALPRKAPQLPPRQRPRRRRRTPLPRLHRPLRRQSPRRHPPPPPDPARPPQRAPGLRRRAPATPPPLRRRRLQAPPPRPGRRRLPPPPPRRVLGSLHQTHPQISLRPPRPPLALDCRGVSLLFVSAARSIISKIGGCCRRGRKKRTKGRSYHIHFCARPPREEGRGSSLWRMVWIGGYAVVVSCEEVLVLLAARLAR